MGAEWPPQQCKMTDPHPAHTHVNGGPNGGCGLPEHCPGVMPTFVPGNSGPGWTPPLHRCDRVTVHDPHTLWITGRTYLCPGIELTSQETDDADPEAGS